MKKNSGLTLIELVISVSILAIVGLIVVGFLSVASKTFAKVNGEVNLQYESQLAMNQIKDLIVDANKGIAYGLETVDEDGGKSFTLIDAQDPNSEANQLAALESADPGSSRSVQRVLIIYNESVTSVSSNGVSTYSFPVVKIVWKPDEKKLYFAQKQFNTVDELAADEYLSGLESNKLLSEYVSSFSISLDQVDEKVVSFALNFEHAQQKYSTTPTVSLRNKVVVSDSVRSLYAKTNIVKQSLINKVTINKGGTAITQDNLSTGNTAHYIALVDVQYGATEGIGAVVWELKGSDPYGEGMPSSVTQDGSVWISTSELSDKLYLTATSATDVSKKSTVILQIADVAVEYGYVKSINLGELQTIDINAPAAIGGTAVSYQYSFEDTPGTENDNAYISYGNKIKLDSSKYGVTYEVITTAPTASYTMSADGVLKVFYTANGYDFTIKATSKAFKFDKISRAVAMGELIHVSGLVPPEHSMDPSVTIKADKTDLIRSNDKYITVTAMADNIINPTYSWTIIKYSGNFVNKSGSSDENKRFRTTNITLSSNNKNTTNIAANKQLDWNSDFSFDVKVTVKGKDEKNKSVEKSDVLTISVGKVGMTVTTTGSSNLSYYDSFRNLVFTYTNLDVNPTIEIDKVYTNDSNDITYIAFPSWISYNLKNKTMQLTSDAFYYLEYYDYITVQPFFAAVDTIGNRIVADINFKYIK